jgi:hypothetical protein
MKNFIILLLLLMNTIQCMELELNAMPMVTTQIYYEIGAAAPIKNDITLPLDRQIYYSPSYSEFVARKTTDTTGLGILATTTSTRNNKGGLIKEDGFEALIKMLVNQKKITSAHLNIGEGTDASLFTTPLGENSDANFTLVLHPKNRDFMQSAIDIAIQNSQFPMRETLNAVLLKACWKVFESNSSRQFNDKEGVGKEYLNNLKKQYPNQSEDTLWNIVTYLEFIKPCNVFLQDRDDLNPVVTYQRSSDARYASNKRWFINQLFNMEAWRTIENENTPILLKTENSNWRFISRVKDWGYYVYLLDLFLYKMRQDTVQPNIREKILVALLALDIKSRSEPSEQRNISRQDILLLIATVLDERAIPQKNSFNDFFKQQEEVPKASVPEINQSNLELLGLLLKDHEFAKIKWDALIRPTPVAVLKQHDCAPEQQIKGQPAATPVVQVPPAPQQQRPPVIAPLPVLNNQGNVVAPQQPQQQNQLAIVPPNNQGVVPVPPQLEWWKQYIPHFVVTAATLIGSIGVAIKNWHSIQQWGWVQRFMQKMRGVNK